MVVYLLKANNVVNSMVEMNKIFYEKNIQCIPDHVYRRTDKMR